MTVYADVLFLVNWSMDFLTLMLASRITRLRPQRWRMLAGSIGGGIFGTLISLCGPEGLCGTLLNLSVMAGMTVIAMGRNNIVRNGLIVCGSGTLLGGIMTALLSLGEPIMMDWGSSYPSVFLGCAAAAWGFTRLFAASSAKTTAEVCFAVGDESRCFTGLRDSGSFLTEPLSGTPVITISREILGGLADRLTEGGGLRIRIIPVKTVTGDGILWGFVPDRVCVDGIEVRAIIAMDSEKRGGFDGIVPAGLSMIHKE